MGGIFWLFNINNLFVLILISLIIYDLTLKGEVSVTAGDGHYNKRSMDLLPQLNGLKARDLF